MKYESKKKFTHAIKQVGKNNIANLQFLSHTINYNDTQFIIKVLNFKHMIDDNNGLSHWEKTDGNIKYFDKFVRCRRRLKEDMEGAKTVLTGKKFQIGMTWLAKKYSLVLSFVSGIESLRGWPREDLLFENLKKADESMQLLSLIN